MFAMLTESLNRIIIDELRAYWSLDPKYRDDLVNNIQGKYSYKTQPQRGIIVRVGGGSSIPLSADNFQGTVESFIFKMQDRNFPGIFLEWVREDARVVRPRGVFPSPPGIYYIEILAAPEVDTQVGNLSLGEFQVHPLLDETREFVMMGDPSSGMVQRPFLPGSLRLYELPSGVQLYEPEDYTSDPATGEISLTTPIPFGITLSADYRYAGEVSTHKFRPKYANNRAIPGVVLAFGRKVEVGDRVAVVVQSRRVASALEYGGRWSLSLEFEVFARDVHDQREILDDSMSYILGVLRTRLADRFELGNEISFGGESEEIYDENADEYFYNATFSVPVETEWSLHVPLPLILREATPVSVAQARRISGLSEGELHEMENNLHLLSGFGLSTFRDPFFESSRGSSETIR